MMNILFLTIGGVTDINDHTLYTDLLRSLRDHGNHIYIVTHRQRRTGLPTELTEYGGVKMLSVRIGNITKCGMIEKGISTLMIENQYKNAIKKYFRKVKFDLVLYSTPPITLAGVVEYVKKRDGAKSYLLLKDIFPQNAVDLGMMTTTGPKSILYRLFRKKEQQLYALSDTIGCMSQANVEFVRKHNPELSAGKVEICPNCIEVQDVSVTPEQRAEIRNKYGIPLQKKVFVYGGNLGKPQGIPFLLDCLEALADDSDIFFLIVGDGTEFPKLQRFLEDRQPANVKLLKRLPKDDYDRMIPACDVGLIFLDHRFTIPNFPSRLLAYMQAKLPVLACTDVHTDVGSVIEAGGFGWWCQSNDVQDFEKLIRQAKQSNLVQMGKNGYAYLNENYTTEQGYQIIAKHF